MLTLCLCPPERASRTRSFQRAGSPRPNSARRTRAFSRASPRLPLPAMRIGSDAASKAFSVGGTHPKGSWGMKPHLLLKKISSFPSHPASFRPRRAT